MYKEKEKIDAKAIPPLLFPPRLARIMLEMEKIILHFFP